MNEIYPWLMQKIRVGKVIILNIGIFYLKLYLNQIDNVIHYGKMYNKIMSILWNWN